MSQIPRLPAPPLDLPPSVGDWALNLIKTLEQFMQDVEQSYQAVNSPVILVPSTVSGLNGYLTGSGVYRYKPALTQYSASRLVFCSNASGGAVPVYSDGLEWRRVTDGSVVT